MPRPFFETTSANDCPASKSAFETTTAHDFYLPITACLHGLVSLAPFSWSEERSALTWKARIDNTAVVVQVQQVESRRLGVELSNHEKRISDTTAEAMVRRVLILDWEPIEALSVARHLDTNNTFF